MPVPAGAPRLLMLHKPRGMTVTTSDERGRLTVYALLPGTLLADGWVPVGRLDRDTRGLLLLTRDRTLVDPLTRPGSCRKEYRVTLRGHLTDAHRAAIAAGIPSPVGVLHATLGESTVRGHTTTLTVMLAEGKNRHLRRLFGALRDEQHGTPLKVVALERIAFGPLRLDLPLRAWRYLTAAEEQALVQAVAA